MRGKLFLLCFYSLAIAVLPILVRGQSRPPLLQWPLIQTYSSVISANSLHNVDALKALFEKLQMLERRQSRGQVRVVWIGDSHTQADLMTEKVRSTLQGYFGNAGRGLVFPYKVAKTTSPGDLISTSTSTWSGFRNSRPDLNPVCGISGHGMLCKSTKFQFQMGVAQDSDSFNLVRLYSDTLPVKFILEAEQGKCVIGNKIGNDSTGVVFHLGAFTKSISISGTNSQSQSVGIYGLSFEKENVSGVIMHTIGVNGAEYKSYLNTPFFWRQIGSLNADLYIISLGTNEAQDLAINPNKVKGDIDSMVSLLRLQSPKASFILCTPPISYYRKLYPNSVLQIVSEQIRKVAEKYGFAIWDLFRISKGLAGAYSWKGHGLLANDLVHFTKRGYELQGQLFCQALFAGYNNFRLSRGNIDASGEQTEIVGE